MAIFTNQASLTYRNVTRNSNIATGQILETLSATKSAVTTEYTPGDNITYIISIVNAGSVVQNGVVISDDLGAYTVGSTTVTPLTYVDGSVKYYANGVLQASPTTTAGPPLSISGISVPAGGNAIIIYEALVNDYAPLLEGSTIVNEATITGTGLSTPIVVSETITARNVSDLTISKSITPEIVTENDEVTYSFVIQNTGNTPVTVADNAIVNDTFNPILTNISVTYNSLPWTEGTNYTYNPTTGAFATNAGQITVPAATYTQDPVTGAITTTPGVSVLTVTGTI